MQAQQLSKINKLTLVRGFNRQSNEEALVPIVINKLISTFLSYNTDFFEWCVEPIEIEGKLSMPETYLRRFSMKQKLIYLEYGAYFLNNVFNLSDVTLKFAEWTFVIVKKYEPVPWHTECHKAFSITFAMCEVGTIKSVPVLRNQWTWNYSEWLHPDQKQIIKIIKNFEKNITMYYRNSKLVHLTTDDTNRNKDYCLAVSTMNCSRSLATRILRRQSEEYKRLGVVNTQNVKTTIQLKSFKCL